jgi:hypothetical protein
MNLESQLEAWLREDFALRMTLLIAAMMIFASGPPLALAIYLWRFGNRVIASARFPPPGTRLVRDAPVITGKSAQSRGRALRMFAATLAVSALLIAATLVRFGILVWTRGN